MKRSEEKRRKPERTFQDGQTNVLQGVTPAVQFWIKIQKQSKTSLMQALTLHQDG
jgi:hypothetical protein